MQSVGLLDTMLCTKLEARELSEQRDRTSDEAIYQAVRTAIVDHRLRPGDRLPEDTLGQTFGVSRTSIRKVLQRLSIDRLVVQRPRRGAEVNRPTARQAADVFANRRLLECGSIPAVVRHFTPEHHRDLHALVQREQAARRAGDRSAAIKHSADFHTQLMAVTDNELTRAFVEQLSSLSSLIIAVYGTHQSIGCDCGEHDELLRLLEAGAVEQAERWMDHHLREIEASLEFADAPREAPDFSTLFDDSEIAS
jgi:DNA-binding GntR family transcriptional regulator